jgi:hypothetical protein
MTTPTVPQKRFYAAGAKKASEWGTAVQLGAGFGMLITDIDGLVSKRDYKPAIEHDTPFVLGGDIGPHAAVDFSLGFDMRYDPGALGILLALLFGTAGVPVQQGATAAYLHTLQWADNVSGKFATFAAERPGKIVEVPSAKPTAFSLNYADGLLKGKLSLRGNKVLIDGATNTATEMDALTYADRHNRIRAAQGIVKMNAQGGTDVAAEIALLASEIDVNFSRPLDAHIIGDSIIEPEETGPGLITVKIKIPRTDTANAEYFDDIFQAEAYQKMLIEFTGSIIASTYAYRLSLFFPRLRMISDPHEKGETFPLQYEFQAEEAAANPTGMAHTRQYIELMNKAIADYLA